jgi:hypothetical protein
MAYTRVTRAIVVAFACAAALNAVAASPPGALADVRAALDASADPFAAVVPAVALLAWVLLLWLGATALLTVAGQLPGALGRGATVATRSIAPRAVRRAVELALGLSLAAGAVAGPATAAPRAGADAAAAALAAAPSLDWPSAGAPAPTLVTAAAAAPRDLPPAGSAAVVVAPGDTLWSLAERALGPGATPEQVAAAWPTWWSANRDVVGPDPHLIHPGDRLTPPPASS